MTPTVTVHVDPAGPQPVLHIVIGGPGVQPSTILELLRPGSPATPVAPPNPSSRIDQPILISPQQLPGAGIGCLVTLAALTANAPWAVSVFITQGGLSLGSATDHGVLTSAVTTSTLWVIFQ
jgi:hypothetical protein